MMKIYTKTGDGGTTSLVGGERVAKDSPRVMAYGDVDELISWIGVLRSGSLPGGGSYPLDSVLRRIQACLMTVSAHFAAGKDIPRLKALDSAEVAFLEKETDFLTERLPLQESFILPSGVRISTDCHVARTVCRRAERSAVSIPGKTPQDALGMQYLNRLSDYLFTLARYLCLEAGVPEDKWIPSEPAGPVEMR